MTFYKVKPRYDQQPRRDGSILIANELYTESEMILYKMTLTDPRFDKIVVNPKDTYFCFGARFAN